MVKAIRPMTEAAERKLEQQMARQAEAELLTAETADTEQRVVPHNDSPTVSAVNSTETADTVEMATSGDDFEEEEASFTLPISPICHTLFSCVTACFFFN